MILSLEKYIRGGIFSVLGDRYVKSDEKKTTLFIEANDLYGHSMSQTLLCDEVKYNENVKLEQISKTPVDNEVGFFVEVELKNPANTKEKTKIFPFAPEKKLVVIEKSVKI